MAVGPDQLNILSVRRQLVGVCLFFILFLPLTVFASEGAATSLRQVIQRTILNNPEVQEKWYALEASSHEQQRSRGAYLPRIDFNSRIGIEWQDTSAGQLEFQPTEASLELAQMLYDGFATRNEVRKFGHARLARFYELLDTSENVALEASRAYLDVLKFRNLLALADTNYQQHRTIYQQVRERVEAGVGRGVDLEQATGRLALADSNRITELTNLHDVSARFLRIVGSLPPAQLEETDQVFSRYLPEEIDSALAQAFQNNPAFIAAVQNVQAAKADRDVRKAANLPRLELRARHEVGHDRASIDGSSDESVVELVLNYNLFRGGADTATIRQFTSQMNQARRQQARVCRTVRQTLDIAFNDVLRLEEQLVQLDRHQNAIANARIAYRNQFDIGQRTLLDLLDTENEYFRARRAYVNAFYDQQQAQARTLAGLGQLLTRLDIRQEGLPRPEEFSPGNTVIDPDSICPPLAAPQQVLSRQLTAPAKLSGSLATRGAAAPVVKPLPVAAPAPAAVPVPAAAKMVQKKSLNIKFPYKDSQFPADYDPQLEVLVDFLKQYPQTVLTVKGHTDNVGSDKYNQKLSRERAESVRDRLMDTFGVSPGRIFISWFGYSQPKGFNVTSEGRSENRRVELLVAMLGDNLSAAKMQENEPSLAEGGTGSGWITKSADQKLPLAVIFPYRESQVSEKYASRLESIAAELRENPQKIVTLIGHTDNVGSRKYNQKLARARTESVRNRLIEEHGVSPGRIYMAWASYDQTRDRNGTPGNAAMSRRTDVQVTHLSHDLATLKAGH